MLIRSSFVLFNFQGAVRRDSFLSLAISFSHSRRLCYYITAFGVCQVLFSKNLNFLLNFSLFDPLPRTLSRVPLNYTTLASICQLLFLKNFKNFQRNYKQLYFVFKRNLYTLHYGKTYNRLSNRIGTVFPIRHGSGVLRHRIYSYFNRIAIGKTDNISGKMLHYYNTLMSFIHFVTEASIIKNDKIIKII